MLDQTVAEWCLGNESCTGGDRVKWAVVKYGRTGLRVQTKIGRNKFGKAARNSYGGKSQWCNVLGQESVPTPTIGNR